VQRTHKDVDIFIPDIPQRDRPRKLVQKAHGASDDVAHRQALCPHRRLERFDGNDGLKWSVGKHEEEAEEEVCGEGAVGDARRGDVAAAAVHHGL
jgi:hypothetical protein